jgi:hypothetical protein
MVLAASSRSLAAWHSNWPRFERTNTAIMTNAVTPQLQPPVPLSTEQQNQLILPDSPWTDNRATNYVQSWFNRAEAWRISNYDRSLRRNDDTYYAVTKVKTWDGTRIPRASIPIWMAVRHVQAIHAHVMQASVCR